MRAHLVDLRSHVWVMYREVLHIQFAQTGGHLRECDMLHVFGLHDPDNLGKDMAPIYD